MPPVCSTSPREVFLSVRRFHLLSCWYIVDINITQSIILSIELITNGNYIQMKEFGIRLTDERIRLGLDQNGFGQLRGVKKNV